jgi:four helix bundle protein
MKKFPHEDEAHRRAIKLARKVADARWPREYAGLGRQASRSANSVVLNLAEGKWKTGASRRHSIRVALGELGETAAAMQLGKIRCWRQMVEPLYELLLPMAQCDLDVDPPAACSTASASSASTGTSAPASSNGGRKKGQPAGSRYPAGPPWEYRFEGTPDGYPRTIKQWEFLRRWMANWAERIHRGEFDDELCDDEN